MLKGLSLSYSAVSAWRDCPQKYVYGYHLKLTPRVTEIPLSTGKMLHKYLEGYYNRLRIGRPAESAHVESCADIVKDYKETTEQLAATAYAMAAEEAGDELAGLVDKVLRIAIRYYTLRGEEDASTQQVLLVERKFQYNASPGVVIPGVIDLVTRDQQGYIRLWEHKTGKTIPSGGRRLRDLQTTLYRTVVEGMLDDAHTVDVIVWNYLRTKEPTIPRILKKGALSRAKDIDTTREVYFNAIQDAGLDPDDYFDELERLTDSEAKKFLPRYELPLMTDAQILLQDFITSAQEIRRAAPAIVEGRDMVRNLGAHCDYCPYSRLCETVIAGGDDAAIKSMYYKRKEERKDGDERSDGDDDELLLELLQ